MAQIDSDDYHDFVFRDGKLIGEFDQMYQKSRETPWHQDSDVKRLDCKIALEIIANQAPFENLIEVGCGLGYFANLLAEKLNSRNVVGVDISPTAISKAKQLFPDLSFRIEDITKPLALKERFEMVVIRGCFWYLFPEIEQVVRNLTDLTAHSGYLLVAQNFPPLESKFVGKETIPTPDSLLQRFTQNYDILIDTRLDDRLTKGANDFWLICLGRKKRSL